MERIEVCCPQSGGEEHFSGCLICGAELVYNSLGTERRCAVCGRESAGNAVCANGHYVCDECHAYGAFAAIIPELYKSREKNPLLILDSVMDLPSVHMHGPEHHVIVPLVLLTALRNNGGNISYDEAMREAYRRASKLPGGTCGFWGVCGAAAGAGIFASLLLGSSPLHKDAWPLPQQLVSDILARLAEIGGPRCCKRTSRVAIEEASRFLRETGGADMPLCKRGCKYTALNRECIGGDCPYFQK